MRLITLISSVLVLVFTFQVTAQEPPQYLSLYIEDTATNQEFFLDWSVAVNERLVQIHEEYAWFPVDENNPIKVVICAQAEFCTQFVDESSVLWFFFIELNADIPISGTSGQVSVNAESSTWQIWSDSEQRIFITGEVFRVIESRLNVWANGEEGDSYTHWDVPEWLWLGSPIVWAADIFPEDGQQILADIEQTFNQTGLNPAQLHYQDADQYWSCVYVVKELVSRESLSTNTFFEYDYLVGTGTLQTEAFEQVFGISQIEFETSFE